MTELRKGDKVRIVDIGEENFPSDADGMIGTIAKKELETKFEYKVDYGTGWNLFNEGELKPHSICPEHGRKLYHDANNEYFCPFCHD